jgi:hypothetical protein
LAFSLSKDRRNRMLKTPQEIARIENWAIFLIKGFIASLRPMMYTNNTTHNILPAVAVYQAIDACENLIDEIKRKQKLRKHRKQRKQEIEL